MKENRKQITYREARAVAINTILMALRCPEASELIYREINVEDEQVEDDMICIQQEMDRQLKRLRAFFKASEIPAPTTILDVEEGGLWRLREAFDDKEILRSWERKVMRRGHLQSPQMAKERLSRYPHSTNQFDATHLYTQEHLERLQVGSKILWGGRTVAMWLELGKDGSKRIMAALEVHNG